MKYSKLGFSGLSVSRICLGTMTWGTQNTQEEANEQIEYALSQGINFMDTAELYAIPPNAETYGKTESIIGNWIEANPKRREEFVLATKIAGPGLAYIRGGGPVTGESVLKAVDGSLERLKTDYIDLYQIHWPNRTSPHFAKHHVGKISFSLDLDSYGDSILEILQALDECVKAGKIRQIGLSNETPWGLNEFLRLSEKHNLVRVTSMQNEFNLLHVKDWPHLMENCVHRDIAYLPWSPLASGSLTGKYLDGARPEGSRWSKAQRNGLFRDTDMCRAAIKDYVDVATKHQLTPAQLALAWCNQVEGVTSTIIGATKMTQLKEDIEAFDLTLSEEVLGDISSVLAQYPAPF